VANASSWRAAGLEDDSKSGMAVAVGDVYNRGEHDVFVTNISEKGFLFQGNNLRLNFLKQLAGSKKSRPASSPTPGGRGARSSAT